MKEWQVTGHLEDIGGVLRMDGVNVVDLAGRYGTPLFVFSEARIRQNAEQIKSAFRRASGKTGIFYASKANSNLAILQIVRDTGLNVEVNSGGELYKALKAGFRPDQVIYNGVAKTEHELAEAIQQRIFCINVDSPGELERIVRVARNLNQRADIALRIVPEVATGSHSGLETGTHETKFGISEDRLFESYRTALSHPESLALIGLHMHIGAQVVNPDKYKAAFRNLLAKAAALYQVTGHAVSHLNIGGGLPVSYIKPHDNSLSHSIISDSEHELGNLYGMLKAGTSPKDVADATIGQLESADLDVLVNSISPEFCQMLPGIDILLEPGSRVIANTAILLSRVQSTKHRATTGDTWLLLDAGFNTLFDAFAYNWYFHAVAADKTNLPPDQAYRLAGPLCDSADVFYDVEGLGRLPDRRTLPDGMQPGDLIAFLDTGGYTLEQMSQYNGQPRAAAVLIRQNGAIQIIRHRDTYEDLIRNDAPLQEG